MKKFIFAVVFSAFAGTFALCSCSSQLESAESFETAEYGDFSFKLRDDFQQCGEDEDADYIYKLNYDAEFTVSSYLRPAMAPEVINTYYKDIIFRDYEFVESDVIKSKNYEVAYTAVESDEEDLKNPMWSAFAVSVEDASFCLDVYHDKSDSKDVKKLASEIFDSLEYVGDYIAPASDRTIENEFVSIDINSEWSENKKSADDSNTIDLKASYIDTMAKFLSSLNMQYYISGEFDTPVEYANDLYKRRADKSERYENVEKPCKTSIFGCDAVRFSYDQIMPEGWGTRNYTEYYFEKGGVIHSLTIAVSDKKGCEEVRKNIDELLEHITIKDISEERQAEIEASKIACYETEHFKFSLSSYFVLDEDSGFNGLNFSPSLQVSECRSMPDLKTREIAERTAEDVYDYQSEVYYDGKRIGDNVFATVAKIYSEDAYEYGSDELYFIYDNGTNALKIRFVDDIGKYDDMFDNKRIMAMLESVEEK